MSIPLILASESPARLKLLSQIDIKPDFIIPANIDEIEKLGEKAKDMALRLSHSKALAVSNKIEQGIIIGADTVPVAGRRIMRKARNKDDVKESLQLLSGRRHQVYTGVCVIRKDGANLKILNRVVKSILKFKLISPREIEYYSNLDEGIGKAGGYTLTGYAESFVSFISGSFSNIIGLPLFETMNMLNSVGFSVQGKNK